MDEDIHDQTKHDGLDRRAAPDTGRPAILVTIDTETVQKLQLLGIEQVNSAILPRNLSTANSTADFIFEQMTSTVRKLGRQAGLSVDLPATGAFRSIHEKDAEIIAPVFLFAHSFLMEGGAALLVALLEKLAKHVSDRWGPKRTAEDDAVLEIIVTEGPLAKRLSYKGPVAGLPDIAKIAKDLF